MIVVSLLAQVPLQTPYPPQVVRREEIPSPPSISVDISSQQYLGTASEQEFEATKRRKITPEALYRKATQTGVYGQKRPVPTTTRLYQFAKPVAEVK